MIHFLVENKAIIISFLSGAFGFFTGRKMKQQNLLTVEIANLQKVREEEEDYVNYMIDLINKYKELVKENIIVIEGLREKIKSASKTIKELKNKIKEKEILINELTLKLK